MYVKSKMETSKQVLLAV